MKIRFIYFFGGCCFVVGWLVLLRAQEAPRLSNIQILSNKETWLQLSAPTGINYRIDASTNLPAWSGLVTLPLGIGTLQHTDTAAPYFNQRYYRAQQVTGTNVFTGDHLSTTNGDVVIHPIIHASFVMRWQGKIIYNNPTNGSSAYPGIPKADLILISHSHPDHFSSSTIDAVRNTNAIIIAPRSVYTNLTATLKAITIVLTNDASANVLGLSVEAVPAYNSNHPRGTGNGYILTMGGKRIYISGDTGDILEMRSLLNIDVAFVCMNSFTMSVTNAASAVRDFQPKVIYPYHFKNTGGLLSDLSDFKKQVGADLGIEVRVRKWY